MRRARVALAVATLLAGAAAAAPAARARRRARLRRPPQRRAADGAGPRDVQRPGPVGQRPLSCASCHDPAAAFGPGARTPSPFARRRSRARRHARHPVAALRAVRRPLHRAHDRRRGDPRRRRRPHRRPHVGRPRRHARASRRCIPLFDEREMANADARVARAPRRGRAVRRAVSRGLQRAGPRRVRRPAAASSRGWRSPSRCSSRRPRSRPSTAATTAGWPAARR